MIGLWLVASNVLIGFNWNPVRPLLDVHTDSLWAFYAKLNRQRNFDGCMFYFCFYFYILYVTALCALKLWPRKWWHLVYHILILIGQACIMYFKCIIMHCLLSLWINEWMNENWWIPMHGILLIAIHKCMLHASYASCRHHTWCTVIEYWMLNVESMNICMIASMTTIQIKWWLSKFDYVWIETKVNHLRYSTTIPMHFIIAFNLIKAHCSSISISFLYSHLSFALLWLAFSIQHSASRHIQHSLLDTKLKYMWHCCTVMYSNLMQNIIMKGDCYNSRST